MIIKMNRLLPVLWLICLQALGTDPYPRSTAIDILHYTFRLEVNDTTDIIAGTCEVTLRTRLSTRQFQLNLAGKQNDGTGMQVYEITKSGKPVAFVHEGDLINIMLDKEYPANDTLSVSISYAGTPGDGLVIGRNKFGDRTFFGDNWPDRGHQWLPTIDHPYDKAKVDFVVTAPNHYSVVATGQLVSEIELSRKRKEWHWKEHVEVPVKVITIGVARFSVEQSGMVGNIPVTTWVFPQNAKAGFEDFAVAPRILEFLQEFIGPFPYEKLAHVQSKTRWGGLENASNIFYFENSVTGKHERTGLIAHETAHQWFGNSVTEGDWHHVWLSEGFATYFAALYAGAESGDVGLQKAMTENRNTVIKYTKEHKALVIDTTIRDIGQVLSTSTYQKAAWVLHMLRERIGIDAFQKGIRAYYSKFKDGNAMTYDFISVMEQASGQDLEAFFRAWLYQVGHPQISATWSFDKKGKTVNIRLKQSGFRCPPGTSIDLEIVLPSGGKILAAYPLGTDQATLSVPVGEKPSKLQFDPGVRLLFEGEIKEKAGF